jgi:hypothetical protein
MRTIFLVRFDAHRLIDIIRASARDFSALSAISLPNLDKNFPIVWRAGTV